ncbi:hypothetical protein D3OALGA1CA_3776 [Olavius algarvensis associated proteobacterium Delta 3]|nr:hypothetical protein D3OALGA1CA_3776 [Olavius algarvensis associated proteobacterium Delta 3]CAB5149840.1 hypothetical protein D3OALGB2SA_4735 [Olavius algarvensis associated proteobacterium Delta 3]
MLGATAACKKYQVSKRLTNVPVLKSPDYRRFGDFRKAISPKASVRLRLQNLRQTSYRRECQVCKIQETREGFTGVGKNSQGVIRQ